MPQYDKGIEHYNKREYNEAIAAFDAAIALGLPHSEVYYFWRGAAHYQKSTQTVKDWRRPNKEELELALTDFDEALRLRPDYPQVYLWKAPTHRLINSKQVTGVENYDREIAAQEKIIADYDRVINDQPDLAWLYVERAKAFGGRAFSVSHKALDQIMRSRQRVEGFRGVWEEARRAAGGPDYQLAIRDYDQAIRLQFDHHQAYAGRASIYLDLGNTEQAIADYKQAIKYNPGEYMYYINLATLYRTGKDYAEGVAISTAGIEHTSHFSLYNMRAHLYTLMGEYENAALDYDEVIRQQPKDNPSFAAYNYEERANAYYHVGRYEDALSDLDIVIKTKRPRPPDDFEIDSVKPSPLPELYRSMARPNTYLLQGRCCKALGERKKAIAALHTALEMNRHDRSFYEEVRQEFEELGEEPPSRDPR